MCISHIARRRAAAHFEKTKCVWVFTFGVNGTVLVRNSLIGCIVNCRSAQGDIKDMHGYIIVMMGIVHDEMDV